MTKRDETIKTIKQGLKNRSGKSWSVTGGKGTAWGWIRIQSLPSHRENGFMTTEDRQELTQLLSLEREVHFQGENIPAGYDYYDEYTARAEGREPERIGQVYWD